MLIKYFLLGELLAESAICADPYTCLQIMLLQGSECALTRYCLHIRIGNFFVASMPLAKSKYYS
ncbi:MAG: hypothetical protein K0S30_1419 [Clostridia bacterium]|jgi:hypothetical protein|nr:hypothetical protein [Clostridia bacterium]